MPTTSSRVWSIGCWAVTAPEVRAAGIVSRGVAGVVDVLVVLVVLAVVYVGWVFVRLGFSPRAFRQVHAAA